MRTVFKYPLTVTQEQTIKVPVTSYGGAPDFLHAGLDPMGVPSVWLEIDTEGTPTTVTVYMFGTGHSIPSYATVHLASFVQRSFVWHVYV